MSKWAQVLAMKIKRNRRRLVQRYRPTRDPLREILSLDEFHHENAISKTNVRDRDF
jgi:hypothetical protein